MGGMMIEFSNRNFIQYLFLPSILLLVIPSYIYLAPIDRKVVFFFFNLILFVVIKQSVMEDEEPTKIDAAFDRGYEKSHVAVSVELVEVENEEEGKMRVKIDEKESEAFDRGNEKKSHVAVSVEFVEVENEEKGGKMRVEIDEESEAKREERDELQEKIEAFIEKMKRQRKMEDQWP